MPEITSHLTIGFNTTIRRLEALSQVRRPSSFSKPQKSSSGSSKAEPTNLFAVLVCRRSFPEVLTSSIPSMLVTAATKPSRARLIDISPQSEAKIAEALKQPRVGVLGIEFDAPGVNNLSRFVLENIHEVDIPWLEQQSVPTYLPVNIESTAITPKAKSSMDTRKRKGKIHEASTSES
ncbi:hypothetical protein LTR84_012070 [Exophiala bonariae]|uniref:Uncharacterized protein n=1 Tax=Exophiala bonariae TaxID=1690606 RepID=A0AAV9NG64_9EURO|nr:hypothetical protein LTR84_012070 [Exophiala bonariae]